MKDSGFAIQNIIDSTLNCTASIDSGKANTGKVGSSAH